MSITNNLLEFFNSHQVACAATYSSRDERNLFAARLIDDVSVLNLGSGGKRHLAKHIDIGQTCFDVDFSGDCDLLLDLDSIKQLPFENNSFDTVCALDVLEHLENFHLINSEILRVARKSIMISLPNDASVFVENIIRNKPNLMPDEESGVYSKYHGLPICKPSDRHKWWLTFWDIVRYYKIFAENNDLQVKFITNPASFKRAVLQKIIGSVRYHNLFSSYVWILLKKS